MSASNRHKIKGQVRNWTGGQRTPVVKEGELMELLRVHGSVMESLPVKRSRGRRPRSAVLKGTSRPVSLTLLDALVASGRFVQVWRGYYTVEFQPA